MTDNRLIKDGKFTDKAKGKTFILNKQDLDNNDQQNNWFSTYSTELEVEMEGVEKKSLQIEVMTNDVTSDTHYSPFEDHIKYTVTTIEYWAINPQKYTTHWKYYLNNGVGRYESYVINDSNGSYQGAGFSNGWFNNGC